jgi:hypothetical protein
MSMPTRKFISTLSSVLLAMLSCVILSAQAPTAQSAQPAQPAPAMQPAMGMGQGANQAKPVLLFDLGHGQTYFSAEAGRETPLQVTYRNMAQYLGAELRVTTQPLSKETLKDVRTLVLFAPLEPVEAAEAQAVVEFVQQGGGLMIGTDEDRRQNLSKTRLNDVMAPFNMKFTADTPYIHNRGAAAAAGRIHPGLREVPYSGGRAVEGGTAFSFILEPDGTPSKNAHASWMEVPGGGRVIAMGEMMAPLLLGEVNATRLGGGIRPNEFGPYWGKDSREFMLEIVSWLTYRMR